MIPCRSLKAAIFSKPVQCTYIFRPELDNLDDCRVVGVTWDFGDGNSSNSFAPVHEYNSIGNYTVNLRLTYQCGSCESETFDAESIQINYDPSVPDLVEKEVTVNTLAIDEVLSASSATFRDSWPLEIRSQHIERLNGFVNGRNGVWRQDATYVYRTENRSFTESEPSLKEDGSFTLSQFQWNDAELNAIPEWLKVNTVTRYSPFSFELENQDVYGRYSGAVYSNDGQLAVALGQNMKNTEMAFTSFEDANFGNQSQLGNWSIGRSYYGRRKYHKIISGHDNLAVVEEKATQLPEADQEEILVDVFAYYKKNGWWRYKYLRELKILCKDPAGDENELTMMSFDEVLTSEEWHGWIFYREESESSIQPIISSVHTHTGNHSLKVSGGGVKSYRQNNLELIPGKSYYASAWLSQGNENSTTPDIGPGNQVTIKFYDKDEIFLGEEDLFVNGPMIDGWMRHDQTFVCTR